MNNLEIIRLKRIYIKSKRFNRKRRGIKFHLTFDQWLAIWVKSGKLSKRGRGKEKFCMARFGDKGPYAIGNVKIITCSENSHEANSGRKQSISERLLRSKNISQNCTFLGRKHSAETKRKMSKKHGGKNNPFFGKKHSIKSRKQMSIARIGNTNAQKTS